MILNIQNYKRMAMMDIVVSDEAGTWRIVDVSEDADYYTFTCTPVGRYTSPLSIKLRRDGIQVAPNDWQYQFKRPTSEHQIQRVTAKWFMDLDNAKAAIRNEIENLIEYAK